MPPAGAPAPMPMPSPPMPLSPPPPPPPRWAEAIPTANNAVKSILTKMKSP